MTNENTRLALVFDLLDKVNENFEKEIRIREELHFCLVHGDYDRKEFEILFESLTADEFAQLIHRMSELEQGKCFTAIYLIDEILANGCPSGCEEALKKLDCNSMQALTESVGLYRTT